MGCHLIYLLLTIAIQGFSEQMEQHNLKSPESVDLPHRITYCEKIKVKQPLCTLLGIECCLIDSNTRRNQTFMHNICSCVTKWTYNYSYQSRLHSSCKHWFITFLCVIAINHPKVILCIKQHFCPKWLTVHSGPNHYEPASVNMEIGACVSCCFHQSGYWLFSRYYVGTFHLDQGYNGDRRSG